MRLAKKSGFAMATIVAASFGFAGLTQAAPLAAVAAAFPAVQSCETQEPSAAEARCIAKGLVTTSHHHQSTAITTNTTITMSPHHVYHHHHGKHY